MDMEILQIRSNYTDLDAKIKLRKSETKKMLNLDAKVVA